MAKRTRRERSQESSSTIAPVVKPVAAPVVTAPAATGKIIDFAREYYYVYTDMRNVSIIAIGLFVLMFVMGYFI